MKNQIIPFAFVSVCGVLCMSGHVAREEAKEIEMINEIAQPVQEVVVQKPAEKPETLSAAKQVVRGYDVDKVIRKSAAKRAVENES